MSKVKVGDQVVITASDEELRSYFCDEIIENGDIYKITEVSNFDKTCRLDNMINGWVHLAMIELSEAGSK